MGRFRLIAVVMTVLVGSSATTAFAGELGVVSTDRFGYTGVVRRYDTLSDAQNAANQVGADIAIDNRDLSLYIVNGVPSFDADANIMMGSWWYSTEGSAGYGNTRGNSGRGFVQLYDEDSSTDAARSFAFQGFDGTYWTEFALSLTGGGADYPNDFTRFWVDFQGNGADKVVYHSYDLQLVAGGLEGTETSPGFFESFNQPTSVIGTYSGIFENVSTTYPVNNGFYTFSLTLDTINWAWDNRADLDPYPFADSYFAAGRLAAVPLPPAGWLGLVGLFGLGLTSFLRRRAALRVAA